MQNKTFKFLILFLIGFLFLQTGSVLAGACGPAATVTSYNGSVYLKTCNQRAWGSMTAVCPNPGFPSPGCALKLCENQQESYDAQDNITVTKSGINGNLLDTLSWSCGGTPCSVPYGTDYTACNANLLVPVVNGACGLASGQSFFSAPDSDLCAAGTAGSISETGSNSWMWSCNGSNGGTNAACYAYQKVNGACGSSHNQSFPSAPTTGLCNTGTASSVSGSGPWTWSCTGLNSGTTANCSAQKIIINGQCGSSHNQSLASAPSSNLCTYGTASSVSGSGPWTWSCASVNGGTTANCSAQKLIANGLCGSANGQSFTIVPTTNLCTSGTPGTPLDTGSNSWLWACNGINGGSPVGCYALQIVNGQCGLAAATYPYGSVIFNGNFCSAGTPNKSTETLAFPAPGSSVSWVCYGINGGTTANCTASQSVAPTPESECGSEARTAHRLLTDKSSNLCQHNFRGFQYQSTYGPWQWYCSPNATGTIGIVSCYGYLSNSAPVISFLTGASTIKEGAVLALKVTASDADGDTRKYSWSCTGGKLSSTTSTVPKYTAPKVTENTNYACTVTVTDGYGGTTTGTVDITVTNTDIACGSEAKAAHRLLTSASAGLCASGSATSFTGNTNGPWAWKCGTTTCAASVSNAAPTIYSMTPDSAIMEGATLTLNVVAIDSDSGDTLSYSWSCTGGNLSSATGSTSIYTAPQVQFNTNYTCTVTVTDNYGGSVAKTVTITDKDTNDCGPQVGAAHRLLTSASAGLCSTSTATKFSGGDYGPWAWTCIGTCNATLNNNAPAVSSITNASTIKENANLSLAVVASDADGDTLNYAWACTGGSVNNAVSRTTTYTAPTVNSDTVYICSVIVADSFGGVAIRSVNITVTNTDIACGSEAKAAHRLLTSSSANLCATGKATNFTTKTYGPWTWKCGTSSCNASLNNAVPTISSITSASTIYEKTSLSLSVVAVDADVNPNTGLEDISALTYSWTCTPSGATLKNNKTANLTFTAPSVTADKNYSCTVKISDSYGGSLTSNAVVITVKNGTPPVTPTCTSFTYSDWSVCQNGTRTRTILTSSPAGCIGGNPILSETCTVPNPIDGVCGTANGQSFISAPTTNLCADGSTPPVSSGASLFTWTCAGAGGGSSTSCSAIKALPNWTNQ